MEVKEFRQETKKLGNNHAEEKYEMTGITDIGVKCPVIENGWLDLVP